MAVYWDRRTAAQWGNRWAAPKDFRLAALSVQMQVASSEDSWDLLSVLLKAGTRVSMLAAWRERRKGAQMVWQTAVCWETQRGVCLERKMAVHLDPLRAATKGYSSGDLKAALTEEHLG